MVKQTYTIRKVVSEARYSPFEVVITRESDTSFEKEEDAIKHLHDLLDLAIEERKNRLETEWAKQQSYIEKEKAKS